MVATSSVRQRGAQTPKKQGSTPPTSQDGQLDAVLKDSKLTAAAKSEWDYKLALAIITILAFVTRFWGINHPNEVVFDEVHFGKVWVAMA